MLGVSEASARLTSVSNPWPLKFSYQGKNYRIQPQNFQARCNGATCTFKVNNGLTLSVAQRHLSTGSTSYSSYSPSSRAGGYGYSRELGYASGQGVQSSYSFNYSSRGSRLASCYRSRGRQYAGRIGCTSGNRGCTGSKSVYTSSGYCYRYVKLILQDCGATSGYLGGKAGKDAGPYLLRQGFARLPTMDPTRAPAGAVITYTNHCSSTHWAGHVEIKVSDREYISDYIASQPRSHVTACRRVSGIYIKN